MVARVAELEAENVRLWDDLARVVTERRLVAEAVAAHYQPGPDGQDDIDRRRVIAEAFDTGRDEAESWRDQCTRAVGQLDESRRIGIDVMAERDEARQWLTDSQATGRVLHARLAELEAFARWRKRS